MNREEKIERLSFYEKQANGVLEEAVLFYKQFLSLPQRTIDNLERHKQILLNQYCGLSMSIMNNLEHGSLNKRQKNHEMRIEEFKLVLNKIIPHQALSLLKQIMEDINE